MTVEREMSSAADEMLSATARLRRMTAGCSRRAPPPLERHGRRATIVSLAAQQVLLCQRIADDSGREVRWRCAVNTAVGQNTAGISQQKDN